MEEVASRYAAAIVSIAKDEGKLEDYKVAILSLRHILDSNEPLLKFLKSYFIKDEERELVVDELVSYFNLPNLSNFIKLLCKKHKIYMYKEIFREVMKELNFELNVFEGYVYSVDWLPSTKILEISAAISEKLNKKVELTNKLDPRLIGGVKVVVHDHIFDGSVKYKLETMKEELKERRNG